jgi:flagellar hook-associated protein 2
MAGIQITGLASGLDWQNIISELITAGRAPETQWKAEQTTNQNQISSLSSLSSDLTAFQTAAQALTTGTTFTARTATIGDTTSGWSAAAAPATNTGQYAVDVTQLATTAIRNGATNVGAPLSTTSDVSGVTIGTMNVATPVTSGFFTVDGQQVTVSASDSLQDVLNRIGTVTSGAVTAQYIPGNDTIQLSSTSAITLGAANDTSNFLSAMALYNNANPSSTAADTISSTNTLGSVNLNSTIADSGLAQQITDVDSSGNGTFSINGVPISFNVNTDTLGSIIDSINNSTAGVTATFNSSDSQFTLTNNTTGDTGISVSEGSGGLLQSMGLNSTSTISPGKNATYTINGSGPFTSASNTLDASADGINGLTINATSMGTQTITVGNDTSGVSTAVNNLISAYNTVQTYITSQTQITTSNGTTTTSTLSENQDITNMQTDLQNMMFNSISTPAGGISSLDQIGIGFTGTSPLLSVVNQSALNNAIQNNPTGVSNLFDAYPGGLVAQINNYVTRATGSNGVIATQTNSLNQDDTNLTSQITNLETQLTAQQAQLTTEFTNMESAESKYQTEESTLNSILNSGSSSSSSSSSSPNTTQQSAFANASSSSATGG